MESLCTSIGSLDEQSMNSLDLGKVWRRAILHFRANPKTIYVRNPYVLARAEWGTSPNTYSSQPCLVVWYVCAIANNVLPMHKAADCFGTKQKCISYTIELTPRHQLSVLHVEQEVHVHVEKASAHAVGHVCVAVDETEGLLTFACLVSDRRSTTL